MFINNGELRFAEATAQGAFDVHRDDRYLLRAAADLACRTRRRTPATHVHKRICDFVGEVHNVVQARL